MPIFERAFERSSILYLFGFFIGIANTAPLLGRSLPVQGQLIACASLAVSFALFLACRKDYAIGLRMTAAFALLGLYILLVMQSADFRQWSFLTRPGQWGGHESDYVGFKLVVFLVSSLPPVATGVMFSLLADRQRAFRGLVAGILTIATVGAVVLIAASNGLYRSSYDVASDWYNGKGRLQFSIISMGMLLILGGMASLFWLGTRRRFNLLIAVFAGLCLLGTIMLIRRVDTILYVSAILLVLVTIYRQTRTWRALVPMLAIAIIPALTWPLVANEFSVSYWKHIAGGLQYRVEAAKTTLSLVEAPEPQTSFQVADVAASGSIRSDVKIAPTVDSHSSLLGNGLGYYAANSTDGLKYPHNLFLETYLESGPVAASVLAVLLTLLLAPSAWRFFNGTISRYELLGAGAAVILILASLKAGDITSVGPVLFFAMASNIAAPHLSRASAPSN